jgi:hypothetical protein
MTLQGHVKNGTIVLDQPIALPEGAAVQVEVSSFQAPIAEIRAPGRKTLAERFKNIVGVASDLPQDLADQHDHYLHGTPKK